MKQESLQDHAQSSGVLGEAHYLRREAIVRAGYISQKKDDKFWILVSAHPGSLKNSC